MVNLKLLKVIRPHIVAGGFLGYLVGALYGLSLGGGLSWSEFLLGYLIVLFMDLSTHYNNDYYDVEVDRSAPFKPFGSVNLLIDDNEMRNSALRVAVGCSVISILMASVSVFIGSTWHLVGVVVLFNALGWLYSAPPVRLHSRRLGEITIAVGTGFCVSAVGYILTRNGIDGFFTLFSVPLILYGFILSLCLQVPDYEVDRMMDKKTIVGLIGRRRTYLVVLLCAVAASATYFHLLPPLNSMMVPWVSLVPAASSLFSVLLLSDSLEHAQQYTKLNISALFLFLACLDLLLLL
ncbi:prenyltransferase [Candidatus Bathyarchaeota archaeon]|nr:prenyltransferase [Candidatus Bathyarchaeota archaeon]MBL7167167.1 prenyltransferase [Candidatus Bathyarchaeota archaeon]